MIRRELIGLIPFAAFAWFGQAYAAPAPATWDDLVLVKSKRFARAYVLPGADFRPYSKVMLDPTEVAFEKDWLRDYNRTTTSRVNRFSESDLHKAAVEGGKAATQIFTKAFTDAGVPVVADAGPDVIRLRTLVFNVRVTAPEMPTAGRSTTYAQEAGSASVLIEALDSATGAVLGRVVDSKVAGDAFMMRRNTVTNRSDFAILGRRWAKSAVEAFQELRMRAPTNA